MNEPNYFVSELIEHYKRQGKNLSPSIADILNKSPLELSPEELNIYTNVVVPSKTAIQQALEELFNASGSSLDTWKQQLPSCSQSAIGLMVSSMLDEIAPKAEAADTQAPQGAEHESDMFGLALATETSALQDPFEAEELKGHPVATGGKKPMKGSTKFSIAFLAIMFFVIVFVIQQFSCHQTQTPTQSSKTTTTTPSTTPSTSSNTPAPTSTTIKKDSPEYLCASIQKGYEIELTDPLVNQFKVALDALQITFPGSTRMKIADVLVAAKKMIDEQTTAKMTLLQLAQELNKSVPPEARGTVTLEETAALYVSLLK